MKNRGTGKSLILRRLLRLSLIDAKYGVLNYPHKFFSTVIIDTNETFSYRARFQSSKWSFMKIYEPFG